jgi:hypothetical protein
MIMKRLIVSVILLAFHLGSYAFDWKSQSNEDLRADMISFAGEVAETTHDRKLSEDLNRFVMCRKAESDPYRWIAETNAFVDRWLRKYPAELSDGGACSYERRALLLLRDYPMHADNYRDDATRELKEAYEASIRKMHREAEQDALKWLAKGRRSDDLDMFKTYNMGFFLRSAGKTVGIDLQWEGGEDEMKKIASSIDVLFVSHPHDDHYSIGLMKAVLAAGKPVIMSYDIIPEYPSEWKIIVDKDNNEGMEANGVSFFSCLGDQGPDAPNNVYLIKVGKWNIAQNGDNAVPEAEAFLGKHKVDLLITACWNGFKRTMDYIRSNPEGTSCIYIPAHENEWMHTVDHREAYCELFSRNDRFGDTGYDYFPSVIMDAAGDSYILK